MEYPEILKQELQENKINLTLFVGNELAAFKGHFDAAPIVPGVVQIQWVVEFVKRYLCASDSVHIERMDALKFQNVIQPDSRISLDIELIQDRIVFSFSSKDKKHSSGKLMIA